MKLACLKNVFSRYDNENQIIRSIPNPLPRQDVTEVPQPPKENLRILCCAISPNSEFLAFADDHKQLTVWSWKENQVGKSKLSLNISLQDGVYLEVR